MRRMGWRCESCAAEYAIADRPYLCGCAAAGRLDLDLRGARPPRPAHGTGLWRYASVLPIAAENVAAHQVAARFPAGGTPLVRADRLADELGVGQLWIKDDTANPSGSFKDRASALVLAAALASGAPVVATASTGNAAVATAAACATSGLPCVVFMPGRASAARCGQLRRYGATVLLVDGSYADAVALSLAACAEWGWLCRTSAVNPYTTQGKKTAALEIGEQLGWTAPDSVVVPVGDGNILVGLHHGFRDAVAVGWLDRVPRLIGVQAEGAAAVYRAWRAGTAAVAPAPADTVADGICVGDPLDGTRALDAVRDTGGLLITVPDKDILAAGAHLAATTGVVAEPSSAAAAAALPELVARRELRQGERVVLVNTGGRGASGAGPADGVLRVRPDLDSVRAAVPELTGAAAVSGVSGT